MAGRALIILGGAGMIPAKGEDDIVICADSGYMKAIEASIEVDHLVGDMDSIEPDLLQKAKERGIRIQVHEREKDLSDGEIALRTALGLGYRRIVLTGGKEGRWDHVVSTLLLPYTSDRWEELEIWLDKDRIILLKEGKKLQLHRKWHVVSIIPMFDNCRVSTTGLKWALDSETLQLGTTRGIHNEPVSVPFSVECEEGSLLVILSDEE